MCVVVQSITFSLLLISGLSGSWSLGWDRASREQRSNIKKQRRMKEITINWFWKATECAQLKRLRDLKLKHSRGLTANSDENQLSKRMFFLFFLSFLHLNFNCSSSSYCHQSHPIWIELSDTSFFSSSPSGLCFDFEMRYVHETRREMKEEVKTIEMPLISNHQSRAESWKWV